MNCVHCHTTPAAETNSFLSYTICCKYDTCSTYIEYINVNNTNETITLTNESIISNYLFIYDTSILSESLSIGSNPFSINLCFSKIYPIELCVVYIYPNNNYTTNVNNFGIYYTTKYDDVNTSLTKGELYTSTSNCEGNYDDCSNIVFESSVTNDDYYLINNLIFSGNINNGGDNNDDELLVNMQCYYSVTLPPTISPTLSPTSSPTLSVTSKNENNETLV